ncbi:hypothetical protein K493DRAFT_103842 [Basidiobolus meristosporus CBS 931.73]|uniref:RING-type domain-containing protein n=1 Tax=Basidiobolus meristosporus CBS 931.73 TaxID=1314790 RepID=A0A1Y1WY34_9FUNG|nr:hypothetical protein K493DRAFT_103842 [Basidiobolus meristosporus CBS 931.73]|eukprot:ORX78295.1 hypothetical protein K493DRAFT_103842 [Basidiobolus meristosporus CBS 931.73]
MGNIQAKRESPDIDGGGFTPNGIYSAVQDYNTRIVRRLILGRRIAPFYKGLAEVKDAVKEQSIKRSSKVRPVRYTAKRKFNGSMLNQVDLYKDAVECPICFLYYPKNINYTRCCHQPICTECFLQMKRPNAITPVTCPYCVGPNFAVIYTAPYDSSLYREGEKVTLISRDDTKAQQVAVVPADSQAVSSDDIRPDHSHRGAHPFSNLNIARRLLRSRRNHLNHLSNGEQIIDRGQSAPIDVFQQGLPGHSIEERSSEVVRRDTSTTESTEIQSLPDSTDRRDRHHKPLTHIWDRLAREVGLSGSPSIYV